MEDDRDNFGNQGSESKAPNGGISFDLMVEAYAQEYESLDNTLNEIDSWMTKLEQQNDDLNKQLDDLLESSRQTRKEIQAQNQTNPNETTADRNMDIDKETKEEKN